MAADRPVQASRRVQEIIGRWQVRPDRITETGTASLVFGTQGNAPVVLKVIHAPGDEWLAGSVIAAFHGQGMVRALQWDEGAVLLERLRPGDPLVGLSRAGRDRQACTVFAEVVASMAPGEAPPHVPTAAHLGLGFERYAMSGDRQIPPDLVAQARQMYAMLCASQQRPIGLSRHSRTT